MGKRLICSFLIVTFLAFCGPVQSATEDTPNNSSNKTLNIGYCEGESYYEFDYALYNIIYGLNEYGLIKNLPEGMPIESQSSEIWDWLCSQNQEGWSVRFVKNAYFSLTDDEYKDMEPEQIAAFIDKKISGDNIGLILSMGTTSGLTTKQLSSKIPMMSFVAADPVKSGIVANAEKSDTPNVWAQIDVDGFKRTIEVMNDIFKPKKVGVVYANSDDAYIYSGADVLDEFCKTNNMEVIREFVQDPETDEEYDSYLKSIKAAYAKLAQKVDLFVMTTSLIESEDFKDALNPFYDNKIPVYSINSTDDVRFGALLAAESSDYKNIGRFGADMIKRFMSGEKLESLPQIYQTAPFLVINYDVARKVGYKPSFDLLLSANKIYIDRK